MEKLLQLRLFSEQRCVDCELRTASALRQVLQNRRGDTAVFHVTPLLLQKFHRPDQPAVIRPIKIAFVGQGRRAGRVGAAHGNAVFPLA